MSDKKKRNLIIVLCVLAIVIAIVAIAFAPFGKKATGDSDSPNISDVSEITQTTTEISTTTEVSETAETTVSTETTFAVPSSTDPIVNPNKNYTLFIDKTIFESSENSEGITTLTAKDNAAVKMTITPVREMSYKQCCTATEKNHKKLSGSAALKIENTNTVYRSQIGDSDSDIVTTVYCVDDKKGGCIIIDCRTPVNATKYMETIEIMLSMFKVL
jgi:predicted lactoylglutathione lyase